MLQLCSHATQEHISCPLRIERAGLMSPPPSVCIIYLDALHPRGGLPFACALFSSSLYFCNPSFLFAGAALPFSSLCLSPSDVAPSRRHKYSTIAALSFQNISRLKKTRRDATDLQTNHGTCSQQIEQTDWRLSQTGDVTGHRIGGIIACNSCFQERTTCSG